MALFSWTRRGARATQVARLADSLLCRHLAGIREAALPRAATLKTSEARGYLRAKATTVLSAAMRSPIRADAAIPAELSAAVLAAAAERATVVLQEQVLRDAARRRQQRPAA